MLLANRVVVVVPLLTDKGRGEGEGIVGGSERERTGRSVKVRVGNWKRETAAREEE